MAPKHKQLTSAKPNQIPRWYFRNDTTKVSDSDRSAWTAYLPSHNAAIEKAYKDLKTVSVGDYYVDTKRMLQINAREPLKTRRVKRFLVDPAESVPTEDDDGVVIVAGPERAVVCDEPVTKKTRVEVSHPAEIVAPIASKPAVSVALLPMPRKDTVIELTTPTIEEAPKPAPQLPQLKRVASKDLVLPPRYEATTQPVVLFPTIVEATVFETIRTVIRDCPTINRAPLDAASVLIAPTRRWLKALGRPEKDQGVFLKMPQPLRDVADHKRIPMSESFVMTAAQAKELADSAIVTYVGKRPESLLLPNESQSTHASLGYKDHLKTQQLMLSGWCRVLYDGHYKPLAKPPKVLVCSTPGINFAYSNVDQTYFSKPDPDDDDTPPRTVLDQDKILARMRLIWQHILLVMDDKFKVNYPVLCGIGCGAFKGKFGARIPRLWGTALAQVVCNSAKVLQHTKAIFVSLPTFGKDCNFAPFEFSMREVLKAHGDTSFPPIVLLEDASMLDIARVLVTTTVASSSDGSEVPANVGVLNPSDVQALRHGWLGMYWDGGHIALEEVLAMQTTLLLNHIGLNGDLFRDGKRLVAMKRILADMEE